MPIILSGGFKRASYWQLLSPFWEKDLQCNMDGWCGGGMNIEVKKGESTKKGTGKQNVLLLPVPRRLCL